MSSNSSRGDWRFDGANVEDETQRRERRIRRDAPDTFGAASTGSVHSTASDRERMSRSGRHHSAPASTTEINHQDEIERIREMRARRMRKDRTETIEPTSPTAIATAAAAAIEATAASAAATTKTRDLAVTRERRSDRQILGKTRPRPTATAAAAIPTKTRSTPVVSRRESKEAGLLSNRRERRSNDLPSHRKEDDSSAYSRSRRERINKLPLEATDEDVLSAYSRARREKVTTDDDDADAPSSFSRSRRDRPRNVFDASEDDSASVQSRLRRDRLASDDESSMVFKSRRERSKDMEDDDNLSANSRSSDRSISRQKPRRKMEQDIAPQQPRDQNRQPPSRSKTGGDDLELLAANRPGEKQRPPVRAKSADHDLLAMDLWNRNKEETKGTRNRETKRTERDLQPDRTRSTDLNARLRERREARAAEKETNAETMIDAQGSTDHLVTEVERRLARRRSNDDLEILRNATFATHPDSLRSTVASDLEMDFLQTTSDDTTSFSIKVRTVSAIDLPQNVVANMPLCPVFKIGFASLAQNIENASNELQDKLRTNGIESICSSQMRSTTAKIMGKRDNGSVDFHQEMRWDGLTQPTKVALVIEIAARAVRTPSNFHASPLALEEDHVLPISPKSPEPTKRISTIIAAAASTPPRPPIDITQTEQKPEPVRNLQRNASGSDDDLGGGLRALWRKATNRKAAELEAAEAAAAVARMLVEQDKQANGTTSAETPDESTQVPGLNQVGSKPAFAPSADYDVSLQKVENETEISSLTEDARLGQLVIPLSQLLVEKNSLTNPGCTQVDRWFQLETVGDQEFSPARWKQPSVHLEISCSLTQSMDESEENSEAKQSFSIPAGIKAPEASIVQYSINESKDKLQEDLPQDKSNVLNPVLEPGVIDFIAMVGCKDIGNVKADNGSKGWVESSPECIMLEQFPEDNEFHLRNGRKALLPEMLQWFCFPEGARIWRGCGPPSHADLNLKRFSASSPPNVASSIAAFDACMNCTTSFSWFVIASNSDEYGSKLVKTYGAVLRFFAPAPVGIDPKQEDCSRTSLGNHEQPTGRGGTNCLWVPMGICLTSCLPIVGVMEAMLLRLCEELSSKLDPEKGEAAKLGDIHKAVASIIVKYQKPIAGAVNCSVPFLSRERFLLSLPPPSGLPPLPHGKAIISACRLLGADGLNFILAAVLTECKILIHSHDIADIAMIAEVVTALIYPFNWSLPYIPILPIGMLEFVEAPLSYILGVPSHSLTLIDRHALEDVVLIDLDNGSAPQTYFGSKRHPKAGASKNPPLLPSQVATNISKAVYKLLRAEEEVEGEYGLLNFGDHAMPRLEAESLAEREFRVSVAMEICGLLRGYQDCTGPVFNRDKFLKTALALFEDRRDHKGPVRSTAHGKVISPRSKRFLSQLVNTQNFHQFLESPESDEAAFFHEVLEILEDPEKIPTRSGDTNAIRAEKSIAHLVKILQKNEDKVPTYQVDQMSDMLDQHDEFIFDDDCDDLLGANFGLETDVQSSSDLDMNFSFTRTLLLPLENNGSNCKEYDILRVLEKAPWRYTHIFNIAEGCKEMLDSDREAVTLRQAIGDRRYHAWKMTQDQKEGVQTEMIFPQQSIGVSTKQGKALDLTTLISSVSSSDATEELLREPSAHTVRQTASTPEQQKISDAKDRDVIRRCLDRAHGENKSLDPFLDNGRDLLAESEKALRNPSAQRFLLSILSQRSRMETQRLRAKRRQIAAQQASVSRLDPVAFSCLLRLSCAFLDSCMEYKEYETAYRLLTLAAGFITLSPNQTQAESMEKDAVGHQVVTMTSSIGLHPIFANLAVWETVMSMHVADRRSEKKSESRPADAYSDEEVEDDDDDEIEYESAVATLFDMHGYDVPGEELSRFAMRISEGKGWFSDDRGRQLLVLARRITLRRDLTEAPPLVGDSCIEMMGRSPIACTTLIGTTEVDMKNTCHKSMWNEISWCHPAAPMCHTMDRSTLSSFQISDKKYMKRSPITALASFGHSVVVTGGLDGGIFLAYSIRSHNEKGIRGVHLDWGSASRAGAGLSSDGEYGVGKYCYAFDHLYGSSPPPPPSHPYPMFRSCELYRCSVWWGAKS